MGSHLVVCLALMPAYGEHIVASVLVWLSGVVDRVFVCDDGLTVFAVSLISAGCSVTWVAGVSVLNLS